MKRFDKNQKIAIIALAIFLVFLIGFYVLSNLVQSGTIPDPTPNQRVQGVLAFVMFCPLLIAMFFAGRYFKSKNSKIADILLFVSVALFIYGIIQALLSLLGAY